MNVTEKQKEIIIDFMKKYPDLGRGRLRYTSENKRKLDELWEKLTKMLNATGFGPRKSAKEWAKTWRDWKSNTLKKAAKHKSHMLGTGGGPPLNNSELTSLENALLDFLTPDATGLTGIPEGGLESITTFSDSPSNIHQKFNRSERSSNLSSNIHQLNRSERSSNLSSNIHQQLNRSERSSNVPSTSHQEFDKSERYLNLPLNSHQGYSDQDNFGLQLQQSDLGNEILNISSDIENNGNTSEQDNDIIDRILNRQKVFTKYSQKQSMYKNKEYLQSSKEDINNENETDCPASSKSEGISTPLNAKRYQSSESTTYSKDTKKPKLMATALNLLEKKSCTSESLKQKMLEVEQEKLQLKKEELAIHKGILEELQNLNNGITSIREAMAGQYLDA